MVKPEYIPGAGDLVWLDFSPQVGREQSGRRPALVLSAKSYNEKSGLAVACPITSRIKGYPFEVVLPAGSKIVGAILCDQLKNVDWRQRQAQRVGKVSPQVLLQVHERIAELLGIK